MTDKILVSRKLLERINHFYMDGMSIYGELAELRAALSAPVQQGQFQRPTLLKDANVGYSAGSSPLSLKPAPVQQQEPLTQAAIGCFVQPVPSHCDRITWRGNYYHLPITHPAPADAALVEALERIAAFKPKTAADGVDGFDEWNRAGMFAAGIAKAALAAHKGEPT